MKIAQIIKELERIAPPSLQESYDNSGLICGNAQDEVATVLIALDCMEEIVDEAIEKKAQLIVAHHPIVFSGLKKLNGKNYIERTIIKAIRNNIAIYAIHTNLDNVSVGVNHKIAEKLGLRNLKILDPKPGILKKLVVYVPLTHHEEVSKAMFDAGAGHIGAYSDCSFRMEGKGTFKAGVDATPHVGEVGKRHEEPEFRIETIVPQHLVASVLRSMVQAHPYEEVAYDLYALENVDQNIGAGMVGELENAVSERAFLSTVKESLQTDCIRYTKLLEKPIQKVAFCGGSGSFLLQAAKRAGAQVFITGDFKYHQFFDAEDDLVIFDVGHFESEQFTIELLSEILTEKFSNIAVLKTEVNTNPISYF